MRGRLRGPCPRHDTLDKPQQRLDDGLQRPCSLPGPSSSGNAPTTKRSMRTPEVTSEERMVGEDEVGAAVERLTGVVAQDLLRRKVDLRGG